LPNAIRKDKVGHIIVRDEKISRRWCRVCSSQTIYVCQKCNVHLHTDCFSQFHEYKNVLFIFYVNYIFVLQCTIIFEQIKQLWKKRDFDSYEPENSQCCVYATLHQR
jgi:hypothetical protein